MGQDLNIVTAAIRNRRSVFVSQFDHGKTIPDDIILEILQNANCAPNHKLTEPWRFVVFAGDGLKTLAEKQADLYKEFSGAKFKEQKFQQLKSNPLLCSHVIAIGCKRSIGMIPEMEEVAAVASAVENIYLSLDAFGIGGYWSTGGVTYMEEAKSFFGLGPDDILMGFFFLGYVAVPSGQRRPGSLDDKLTWVRN